jgi:hypothetical protein
MVDFAVAETPGMPEEGGSDPVGGVPATTGGEPAVCGAPIPEYGAV